MQKLYNKWEREKEDCESSQGFPAFFTELRRRRVEVPASPAKLAPARLAPEIHPVPPTRGADRNRCRHGRRARELTTLPEHPAVPLLPGFYTSR